MPAEEHAAARDSVAVTCGQWSRKSFKVATQ